MKYTLILFLFFLSGSLGATYCTEVESDVAHYNGETITLTGRVSVKNALGQICSEQAILTRDLTGESTLDFPWAELTTSVVATLADGGQLTCDYLFIDYPKLQGFFRGAPQVCYTDPAGKILANVAVVDYIEVAGKIHPVKVTLEGDIQLINYGSPAKPALQYALADSLIYYPETQAMLLSCEKGTVLFFDEKRHVQMAAKQVWAERNPETQKEAIQGIGDVRFILGPEELERLKLRFHSYGHLKSS